MHVHSSMTVNVHVQYLCFSYKNSMHAGPAASIHAGTLLYYYRYASTIIMIHTDHDRWHNYSNLTDPYFPVHTLQTCGESYFPYIKLGMNIYLHAEKSHIHIRIQYTEIQ